MLLTIDIGNTHTVLGIFKGDEIKLSITLATDENRTADEMELYLDEISRKKGFCISKAEGAIVSSVVPNCDYSIEKALTNIIGKKPIMVGPGVKTGLNILYDNPREVGADRIVNAVGAIKRHGAPLIIIDLGTATTYCVIDKNENYLGGVISPGIKTSSDALFKKAAKLPRVDLTFPDKILSKNTVDAIRAGIMCQVFGEIIYTVNGLKKEVGLEDAKVIATGGFSESLKEKLDIIDYYEKDLTLWGLKTIYEKNTTI